MNIKCPNCGSLLLYEETESTELGDRVWIEYELYLCPHCDKLYDAVHTYDLVDMGIELGNEVKITNEKK